MTLQKEKKKYKTPRSVFSLLFPPKERSPLKRWISVRGGQIEPEREIFFFFFFKLMWIS